MQSYLKKQTYICAIPLRCETVENVIGSLDGSNWAFNNLIGWNEFVSFTEELIGWLTGLDSLAYDPIGCSDKLGSLPYTVGSDDSSIPPSAREKEKMSGCGIKMIKQKICEDIICCH